MLIGSTKYTIVLQAVLVVCLLNGLFVYIYIKSGYASTLSLYECNSGPLSLSPLSIKSSHEITFLEKQTQVIYYKTHKTASTTVGSIMFRFGALHGLRFHNAHNHYYYIKETTPTRKADISLFHHQPADFEYMIAHYKAIIPAGKFLTVLREPMRRYLSHYHYYNEPINQSFRDYITWKDYNNFMSKDLGIFNKTDLDTFMAKYYSQFFFLITDKLDESLLLLKYSWNWSLQDILYVALNDGCATGFRNYDMKPMSCLPTMNNLTDIQLTKMKENNALDLELYERAYKDLNAKLNAQPKIFWEELALFQKMLLDLKKKCTKPNPVSSCAPFLWMDTEYELKINDDGMVLDYPRMQIGYPT